MEFFRSVFSDDPDPQNDEASSSSTTASSATAATTWSLGGLVSTITSRSESVITTVRRDLKEFGTGLVKESQTLIEITDRAVKDLPISLESLDSLANFIVSQSKSSSDPYDSDSSSVALDPVKYSRIEAIQGDEGTYVGGVEDEEEYGRWKLGFDLGERREEVEELLMRKNGVVEGIYRKVVPGVVDHETFWCRYFYRVERMKKAEVVRASLVKRAMGGEEELSWDVDEEDEEKGNVIFVSDNGSKGELIKDEASLPVVKEMDEGDESKGKGEGAVVLNEKLSLEEETSQEVVVDDDGSCKGLGGGKVGVEAKHEVTNDEKSKGSGGEIGIEEKHEVINEEDSKGLGGEVGIEEKREIGASVKDSDVAVVSRLGSVNDEDLGWDEIEDVGSGDEKKGDAEWSHDRAELWKQRSGADEFEDLSWDIEDDDEPVKA